MNSLEYLKFLDLVQAINPRAMVSFHEGRQELNLYIDGSEFGNYEATLHDALLILDIVKLIRDNDIHFNK